VKKCGRLCGILAAGAGMLTAVSVLKRDPWEAQATFAVILVVLLLANVVCELLE